MDHVSKLADSHEHSDRRRALRFYLNQRPTVDVLVGRQRMNIEAGQISDASSGGLGIRCRNILKTAPGAPVTVATQFDSKVLIFTGRIASARNGVDLGIEVREDGGENSLDVFANARSGVAVAMAGKSTARVKGAVSMSARHAFGWAIDAGARCLDMSEAVSVDSAGLGLLMMLRDRHALTVKHCTQPVCRLIAMAGVETLCDGECGGRP